MDLGIADRIAMVAAGSNGYGRATAIALAREGAHVSVCARGEERFEALKADLAAAAPKGTRFLTTKCDITKKEDIEHWYAETKKTFGHVDIMVTHAPSPPRGVVLEASEEKWLTGMEGSVFSVTRMCELAIPDMQKKKWGRVVMLTGFNGERPQESTAISSALRAALSMMARLMARRFGPDNINTNALLPGYTDTAVFRSFAENAAKVKDIAVSDLLAEFVKNIPQRRIARPEEIGEVAAFLASERASYVNGSCILVDGGLSQATMY